MSWHRRLFDQLFGPAAMSDEELRERFPSMRSDAEVLEVARKLNIPPAILMHYSSGRVGPNSEARAKIHEMLAALRRAVAEINIDARQAGWPVELEVQAVAKWRPIEKGQDA